MTEEGAIVHMKNLRGAKRSSKIDCVLAFVPVVKREWGELRQTTKPEKDGLNKVIWQDDSQVVNLTVISFIACIRE